jgi:hypothetical protein
MNSDSSNEKWIVGAANPIRCCHREEGAAQRSDLIRQLFFRKKTVNEIASSPPMGAPRNDGENRDPRIGGKMAVVPHPPKSITGKRRDAACCVSTIII